MLVVHIGLKRPKVVYRSLYSATVASQSLPNGFPYCYRPILSIDIDRTWAHHAIFRLHTRDVATARAARRHSSPLSARHARTHVAQQALGHKSLLRVVCRESRREKRSACDPLGPGTPCTRSVRRPKSDMQHGAPVHPGMCTHTSEHARAFRAQMGRGKLQLQPQRPHGGGRAEKSATPQRKMRFQRPSANDICDTRLSHGARPLRSTAVAIAPLPLPACLKILPFQKDDNS